MSQPELAELYRLIRDLTAKVADMGITVARIDERLKASEERAAEADALETRVKDLELDKAKVQGVGMAAKALWAFVGAGGIGFVAALYQLVIKRS